MSIAQPKELYLIQKSVKDTDIRKSSIRETDRNSKRSAEQTQINMSASAAWKRLNQSLPVIAGILNSISRDQAHVFPIACRLAKRWLSAHGYPVILCPFESESDGLRNAADFFPQSTECDGLVDSLNLQSTEELSAIDTGARMTEVAVELLVLYAAGFSSSFEAPSADNSTRSTSYNSPSGSPVAAFLRFLNLLANYDWEKKPLLVDLNEGFSGTYPFVFHVK